MAQKLPELDAENILVRISGPDRPGITAGLMSLLATAGAVLGMAIYTGKLAPELVAREFGE